MGVSMRSVLSSGLKPKFPYATPVALGSNGRITLMIILNKVVGLESGPIIVKTVY